MDYRADGSDSEESHFDGSDDSNEEGNWRNDYPDTDSEVDSDISKSDCEDGENSVSDYDAEEYF